MAIATAPAAPKVARAVLIGAWPSQEERHAAIRTLNEFYVRAFAIAVRATRVRMGDTIPAFGRRCGVSPEAVRRWEAGRFDTTTLFDAFGRIGVDLTGLAEAVSRGYAAGIGSPWFEIEDIGKLGA